MAQLAANLSRVVDAVVVDRTQLDGRYDLDVTWTPQGLPLPKRPDGAPAQVIAMNGVVIQADGPPLEIALQEQLGLKLVPQRGAVVVRVIDRATRPTPD